MFSVLILILINVTPASAKNIQKAKTRVLAQSQIECSQKPWNFERKLSIQKIKIVLDSLSRHEVIQITWGELLIPQSNSVALPLLTYLSRTEENKYLKGYFEWLSHAAFADHNIDNDLSRWPWRRSPKAINVSLRDLCAMYKYAGE